VHTAIRINVLKSIAEADLRLSKLSYEAPKGQKLSEYKQSLKDKKEQLDVELEKLIAVRDYVTIDKTLTDTQKKFYEELINKVQPSKDYKNKINQILDLRAAEILLEKAKKPEPGKENRLRNAEKSLKGVTDEHLQIKKMEILKAVAGLKGGNKPSTGDKTNQIAKSKSTDSFASKLKEVRETQEQLLATIGKIKETNNGKLVATAEYKTLFGKFKKLVSEWENLATTTAEKNQAQGVKDLIKNFLVK